MYARQFYKSIALTYASCRHIVPIKKQSFFIKHWTHLRAFSQRSHLKYTRNDAIKLLISNNRFEKAANLVIQFFNEKREVIDENGIRTISWAEMMKNEMKLELMDTIIKEHPSFPLVLVKQLISKCDPEGALVCAKIYNVSYDDWPKSLQLRQDGSRPPWSLANHERNYLTNTTPVQVVESIKQFIGCLDEVLRHPIIGIDHEQNPNNKGLVLIQIALPNRVFIINMDALIEQLEEDHWKRLMSVYTEPNVLKLAYDFEKLDLVELQKSCPLTIDTPVNKMLDLRKFSSQLSMNHPEMMKSMKGDGLSRLCNDILGVPIKKNHGAKHWEMNPFRTRLLYYAALDAHCLIQIYKVLHQRAKDLSLNYQELVSNSMEKNLVILGNSSKPE